MTEREAREVSLNEQYRLASERYREVNDRSGVLQSEIFEDEWREGATRSEVVPGDGGSRSGELPGATEDNSYYFPVRRWHDAGADPQTLLREVARAWREKGWKVSEEIFWNDEVRITTMTEDGFWFSVDEQGDEIQLTGFSPLYWGDQVDLMLAIAARRDAEDAAGSPWDTTDRDEEGYAYRLPGTYRPFPAWDAVS